MPLFAFFSIKLSERRTEGLQGSEWLSLFAEGNGCLLQPGPVVSLQTLPMSTAVPRSHCCTSASPLVLRPHSVLHRDITYQQCHPVLSVLERQQLTLTQDHPAISITSLQIPSCGKVRNATFSGIFYHCEHRQKAVSTCSVPGKTLLILSTQSKVDPQA